LQKNNAAFSVIALFILFVIFFISVRSRESMLTPDVEFKLQNVNVNINLYSASSQKAPLMRRRWCHSKMAVYHNSMGYK